MISRVITKMYLWGHSKLVQDLEDLDIGRPKWTFVPNLRKSLKQDCVLLRMNDPNMEHKKYKGKHKRAHK